MTQRGDISDKYEFIYQTLAKFVADHVAASNAAPEETYAELKQRIPVVWLVAIRQYMTGKTMPLAEQKALARDFYAELLQWTEVDQPKTGTRADYFRSTDTLFARTVLERVRGCDLVLDLGCGWGHRMVDLHRLGLNATFFGGDRSRHTQALVKSLAALFPTMKLDWFRFDYLAPDFSAVPKNCRKVALVSWHAIEQVTNLGPSLFDAALSHFSDSEVVGVHIEPITFQIDPTYKVQREYSVSRAYNLDLYDTLKHHPGISITETVPFLCDHFGADASLVTWRANQLGSRRD